MRPPQPPSAAAAPAEVTPAPAPAPAPPMLEMIDVAVPTLLNPRLIVLEAVNWSVAAGDFWVVGGLHGSGKSHFVAVAAGILPPARGTLKMFGHELPLGFERERLKLQSRVGLVFDGGRLLNHLTIAENIALPIRYHGNARLDERLDEVCALLKLIEMEPWAALHPGSISANRRQRAGLARALAMQPEVLLLDAPLTGLDPTETAWWLRLLAALHAGHPIVQGRPMTLVVTADDLRLWPGYARQYAVLKNRRLVTLPVAAAQTPEALLTELQGTEAPTPL